MAEFYETLGLDFVINAIIEADDANNLVVAVKRELNRRGIVSSVAEVTPGHAALSVTRDKIRSDLTKVGYNGATNPAQAKMTASEVKGYATYLQMLYKQKLEA